MQCDPFVGLSCGFGVACDEIEAVIACLRAAVNACPDHLEEVEREAAAICAETTTSMVFDVQEPEVLPSWVVPLGTAIMLVAVVLFTWALIKCFCSRGRQLYRVARGRRNQDTDADDIL